MSQRNKIFASIYLGGYSVAVELIRGVHHRTNLEVLGQVLHVALLVKPVKE